MSGAARPRDDEAAPSYRGYISLVPHGDVVATLAAQIGETAALVAGAEPDSRYAPGKWTVAETLGHMTDTERVFAFRALWFARGDTAPLPGFDQDQFVAVRDVSGLDVSTLLDEFRAVRASTLSLLRGLDAAAWDRRGTASGHPMSTRGAAYVIAGHERHHAAILRDRYLAS